jgi:hypothetical protein
MSDSFYRWPSDDIVALLQMVELRWQLAELMPQRRGVP